MTKKQELAVSEELSAQLAIFAAEEAGDERPAVGNISLRSGVISYMGQTVPNNTMDVVVLGSEVERSYYDTAYDPDNIVPPRCYSIGGEVPADNVPEPLSESCATCPMNEWGSGRGKGKACGEKRRLAMIPASALDTGIAESEVALMKVPVTSLKNWSNYVNKVKSAVARPTWAVVTTISVKPDPKTQFKVNFDLASTVDSAEQINALRTAHEESGAYTGQPFDMSPVEHEEAANSGKF